jgi:vacuolar protein-sorting-associated protein 4
MNTTIKQLNVMDLEKACEKLKTATEADEKGDIDKALTLYIDGIELLMNVLQTKLTASSKTVIEAKAHGYIKRAEVLKLSRKGASGMVGGGREQQVNPRVRVQPQLPRTTPPPAAASSLATESVTSIAPMVKRPSIKWKDIAGLETTKQLLHEAIILPQQHPAMFKGPYKAWKAILLYGPPGTGKSYLAKAAASECETHAFFAISSSDIVSKWQGDSEKHVKDLFLTAQKNRPCIIFIDEIDSLCTTRGGESESESARRIKTEFLVQMDGVNGDEEGNGGVVVLAATNAPWALDPGIRRRFEKRVYIPLPDVNARRSLLSNAIQGIRHTITPAEMETIVQDTDGYSGADMIALMKDVTNSLIRLTSTATYFKITDYDDSMHEPCTADSEGAFFSSIADLPRGTAVCPSLHIKDLQTALVKSKPTVSRSDIVKLEEFSSEFGNHD